MVASHQTIEGDIPPTLLQRLLGLHPVEKGFCSPDRVREGFGTPSYNDVHARQHPIRIEIRFLEVARVHARRHAQKRHTRPDYSLGVPYRFNLFSRHLEQRRRLVNVRDALLRRDALVLPNARCEQLVRDNVEVGDRCEVVAEPDGAQSGTLSSRKGKIFERDVHPTGRWNAASRI